jgi:iron complex outermembrane receptor protein
MNKLSQELVLLACMAITTGQVGAATPDLTQFSIEDLMQVKVVSAAKVEQALEDTAAAVFVITADDIRRSGVTNVMEALRLAPGVEVARIDSSRWAITIRGFNGRFANKLLVMIDGRSIYAPQSSGVYWEVQDLFLPDIERIEVVRGPGGSLWGANAVNGVINIITKSSKDTQGGLVTLTAGNKERAIAGVRYGGKLGDDAQYRIYGQFTERDGLVTPDGHDAGDDWRIGSGGFRLDWTPSVKDTVAVQGGHYNGNFDQNFVTPIRVPPYSDQQLFPTDNSGSSLQARWEHRYSPTEQIALQVYYQQDNYGDVQQRADLETFDVDFQHSFKLDERQEIVWGANYRRYQDHFEPAMLVSFSPDARTIQLFSLFAQDQVALTEQLRLIVGAKIEHNDYTGWEWQPNLRLLWQPTDKQRVWGAVSRAVRTPSRAEEDGRTDFVTVPPLPETGGLPAIVALVGDGNFNTEKLTAYELGYRTELNKDFSLDFTAFYNDYDHLLSTERGTPFLELTPLPPHLVFPLYFRNAFSDDNYGAEIAADWRPFETWRLQLAYSYLWSRPEQRTWSPLNRVSLLSSWKMKDDWELDAWLYYVDGIGSLPTISPLGTVTVEPYLNLTLRLGWRPRKDLELSLVGTNLLEGSHLEFVQEAYTFPVEVERSLYGQVKWSF